MKIKLLQAKLYANRNEKAHCEKDGQTDVSFKSAKVY